MLCVELGYTRIQMGISKRFPSWPSIHLMHLTVFVSMFADRSAKCRGTGTESSRVNLDSQ